MYLKPNGHGKDQDLFIHFSVAYNERSIAFTVSSSAYNSFITLLGPFLGIDFLSIEF